VRARACEQLAQLQFHCGKPPPAPEPRTLINMAMHSGVAAREEHRLHARRSPAPYRLAMYIVISKPKRRSV